MNSPLGLNFRGRIHLLVWAQRGVWLLPVGVWWGMSALRSLPLAAAVATCALAAVALRAWEHSLRRRCVREARLPTFLAEKLMAKHPELTRREAELVLHGLRQFFLAHLRSGFKFVAMPSRVVDDAWHEFILHTRGYQAWCAVAFGKLLHHTPAEVLGRNPQRNDGLRRTWYWACKEEGINPRQPSRLPLLFALDKKLGIADGFSYVPDCRDINRQGGSGVYCGTGFVESGSGGADGDPGGFGGSEPSASGDGGSGDGGGDGGGGCGGD